MFRLSLFRCRDLGEGSPLFKGTPRAVPDIGVLGLEEFLAAFLGFFFIWQVLVDKNLAMDSS
jgi:hypothetical protein